MGKKEEDILCALRNKFLYYSGVPQDCFLAQQGKAKTNECIYYLREVESNLKKGYKQHLCDYSKDRVPTELGVIPMASLRSSAALTYNLFGDGSCQINAPDAWGIESREYKIVRYEWKHQTIGRSKANLDAYLNSGNCHLFVEMKMLEPLTRTHPFKSIDKYLVEGVCPKVFQNAIIDFQTNEPEFFDAFQMIKHLLAIYNFFKKMESTSRMKVVLLNCHWEPSEDYKNRHNSYSKRTISLRDTYIRFKDTADRFNGKKKDFLPLFDSIGVDLELATCDHRKLIEIVGKKDDPYLKRYEI